ncbi:MAG: dihydroorotate dehydrogenase [Clostridia bacterium]|nr:dihydroorotate dehydrogenase [Clostridia bacterium]
MVDLKVSLCGWELDNPVIPASGTFGYGAEFKDFYDINILGSIALKGTTKEPRYGNPTPRIADCSSGMINSVGLQNPGIDKVISEEIPNLKTFFHKKSVANACGFSIEEYVEVASRFDECEDIGIIELNVSCPNVKHGGMGMGTTPESAYEVTSAVKKAVKKPVFVKLTPNVTDITAIARAAAEGGADGLALINTALGMRIDLNRRKPILANVKGGFSGRAIFPIALRAVYEVYEAVDIPLIGIGGIATAEDVIEMMLAGATAIEVGAENLINPYACKQIIDDLPAAMEKYGINKLTDIIGGAHRG